MNVVQKATLPAEPSFDLSVKTDYRPRVREIASRFP